MAVKSEERMFRIFRRSDNAVGTLTGKKDLATILKLPIEEIPDVKLLKWSIGDYVITELNREKI